VRPEVLVVARVGGGSPAVATSYPAGLCHFYVAVSGVNDERTTGDTKGRWFYSHKNTYDTLATCTTLEDKGLGYRTGLDR